VQSEGQKILEFEDQKILELKCACDLIWNWWCWRRNNPDLSYMDTCTQGEFDSLTITFDGFYEFFLILENFASSIKDGAFDDRL